MFPIRRLTVGVVASGITAALLATSATASVTPAISIVTNTPTEKAANTGIAISGGRLLWESQQQLETDLDRLVATGATWLRFDVPWAQMEWVPGEIHWENVDRVVGAAKARGLKLLGILGTLASTVRPVGSPGNYGASSDAEQVAFANFAKAAAARYAGRIDHWEIWNEPNLDQSWFPTPSATAYTRLLSKTYPAIKSVAPNAYVLTGGDGGAMGAPDIDSVNWYRGIYAAGAKPYFDGAATHPYPNRGYPTNVQLVDAASIRSVMDANGDASKLLWGTETGAPTGGPYGVTETDAVKLMQGTDTYWTSLRSRGPLFWYTVQDFQDSTSEGYFGLYRVDGSPKPTVNTLQSLLTGPTPTTTSAPTPTPTPTSSPIITSATSTLTSAPRVVSFGLYASATGATADAVISTPKATAVKAVIMAVRDAAGRNFDIWWRAGTTLTGRQYLWAQRVLPPGTYTYRVSYLGQDGVWTEITPPRTYVQR